MELVEGIDLDSLCGRIVKGLWLGVLVDGYRGYRAAAGVALVVSLVFAP